MTTTITETTPQAPTRRGGPIPEQIARALATGGGVLTVISCFLAWTWTSAFPGDLTVYGYPGGLQWLVLVCGALTTLFGLSSYGIKGLQWLTPAGADAAIKLSALGAFYTSLYTTKAISSTLGGLVNLEPGGFIALIAAAAAYLGARSLPFERPALEPADPEDSWWERYKHNQRNAAAVTKAAYASGTPKPARALPAYAEILIIAAVLAVALGVFTYGITTPYQELFIGFLIAAGFGFGALNKSGLIARFTALTAKHRNVALVGAFVAAMAFPLTQTDDQYATLGVNILIFATVALGLNIVVGLTGLLDLGYVAFLGVGAYTAALVSGAPNSPFGVQFPFWAAILAGAAASMIFGVLIGAPTLRLRGDYLAIVTLGFGEIFRITMTNFDGVSGPNVTNGSKGISNIPNVDLFGFDFGAAHTIAGFTIGRFANYFLLMLLVTLIVVMVFRRSAESRIGRAWVAIREDETAAEAMGINGFRVKLIAFALGATLAGLAGAVQAHVQYTVTPDQYQFANSVPPNSAFLLAAVVLGGMGTISGPLVGGSLLFLIPNKLQFLGDYQLLVFGVALVILMRLRPEGLIPNRRNQLELHQDLEAPTVLSKAGA
ncbi:branched-chain amino acid transport system permease protein [Streptomyces sp. 3211.6]|uniref:branched-chain amino acid ABC transporter permease n=1 Tax=Streptomyces TaxID=1883 RepID=UPI0009A4CCE0|nr:MULTISPECIES: branched-chain amino acid ABC transporter permease [Streptomyces]RKT04124.1 branched-chain amino acid transport system permease protein [Streptomyces sp. 3211.6]RPF40001.1 branched-chain amino acid transport system permease protein [Streptomyces sp. Ag109_G2-6]